FQSVFRIGEIVEVYSSEIVILRNRLKHSDRRRGVLNSGPGAVEDSDFFSCRPSRTQAGNNFAKFGMDIFLSHDLVFNCVMQLAHDHTLVKYIDDHRAALQQARVEFLLVRAVRADRSDEGSWPDILMRNECMP